VANDGLHECDSESVTESIVPERPSHVRGLHIKPHLPDQYHGRNLSAAQLFVGSKRSSGLSGYSSSSARLRSPVSF
jgi:hypothetical protein